MLRSVLTLGQISAMSADDAAAFWLVRQDGADDPREDDLFQQWLEADVENGAAWARACAVWESLGDADEPTKAALREQLAPSQPRRARWSLALAASIALVAVTGGALVLTSRTGMLPGGVDSVAGLDDAAPTQQVFAAEIGARKTVKLPDGSVIVLNTGSAISVGYTSSVRRIELLRGQALFTDTHDARRPFIVQSGERTVTAIGTQFDVQLVGDAMRVVLVDGRVNVRATTAGQAKVVDLRAGQALFVDRLKLEVSDADLTTATEWQRGRVTFHDTSLADAAAELNRYARGKRLLIRDPAVASIRVSGAFQTDDIGRFARTTAQIYPVRIAEGASTIEIVSGGSPRR